MKMIDCGTKTVAVDETKAIVSQLVMNPTNIMLQITVDSAVINVFRTSALEPIELVTRISPPKLHRYAAELLQTYIAAKLASTYVTYVSDNYIEFIKCLWQEQAHELANMTELDSRFVLDWVWRVADRVTGGQILTDLNKFDVAYRRADELFEVVKTTNETHHRVLHRKAAHGPATYVFEGTEPECRRLARRLTESPKHESITSFQMQRWVDLDNQVAASGSNDELPIRSIWIPSEQGTRT